MIPANGLNQPRVIVPRAFVDPKLARIRAAILTHRGRFKPDQLGAPGSKAFVAPPRQLARTSVRIPIAALHGMDRERVSDAAAAQRHGAGEDVANLFAIRLKAHMQGPLSGLPRQLIQRLIREPAHYRVTAAASWSLPEGTLSRGSRRIAVAPTTATPSTTAIGTL